MLFVYVTCKNAAEAGKIGESLVKKRLAACATVIPSAKSFFFWHGKLQKTREALLFLKTLGKNKAALEKQIKKMHSYDVPCILFFKPGTTKEYGKWIENGSS